MDHNQITNLKNFLPSVFVSEKLVLLIGFQKLLMDCLVNFLKIRDSVMGDRIFTWYSGCLNQIQGVSRVIKGLKRRSASGPIERGVKCKFSLS